MHSKWKEKTFETFIQIASTAGHLSAKATQYETLEKEKGKTEPPQKISYRNPFYQKVHLYSYYETKFHSILSTSVGKKKNQKKIIETDRKYI